MWCSIYFFREGHFFLYFRTNKEHSRQHVLHWHDYIRVNWYSGILSLRTQQKGTPWELWPILVKYRRDKKLHTDEEGGKQSWKKMKIRNVFKQSQAKHGQHSRIMASGLVSGVGRLMMGDALWLFKCVCVCVCVRVFSLYLSVSHQSAALASRITGSESSSGGFFESRSWSHSTFIWWQATDKTFDTLSLVYVLWVRFLCDYPIAIVFICPSSFCVCVGPSFCCYDDTTGHNSSADAANPPTPSSEPPAAPAVTATTTSTDVTAGTCPRSVSHRIYSFRLNVSNITRVQTNTMTLQELELNYKPWGSLRHDVKRSSINNLNKQFGV